MKKLLANKKAVIACIIAAVVLIVALGGFLFYNQSLQPVSTKSESVSFEVESGEAMTSIISRLKDENLIKSELVTKMYSKLNGLQDVKAGNFVLDKSWSTSEILEVLNDAKKAKGDEVSITFREGIWAKDIAVEIENKLGIKAKDLIALWNDTEYIKELMKTYPFLQEDVLNDQTRVKLEGYLFPETYTFAKDADAKEITKIFLDHFQSVYTKYESDIKNSGMSIHDVITLASIVQYEASKPEDMKMIAGVFFNRLNSDMTLGSSVTICYAMYDKLNDPADCEVNTNIDSPYNTYLHKGLPIGPIENPGEEAIDAVLHPTKSDYLYFVADIYGDGTVYYSKTLDEQEANIDKYNLRK